MAGQCTGGARVLHGRSPSPACAQTIVGEVIAARLGLFNQEPETLENLSQHLGLTKERVRQLRNEALVKLRRRIRRSGVKSDTVLRAVPVPLCCLTGRDGLIKIHTYIHLKPSGGSTCMQTTTSKEFNRQASALRRSASSEPLLITERGRPTHVLMSYAAYQALQVPVQSVADALAMPVLDALDTALQPSRELARAADLS